MESRPCSNCPVPWLLSADTVDVLKVLGMRGGQAGVPEGPGLCPQRAPEGDRAFRVGKASTLGVPTWKLFPGESGQEGLGQSSQGHRSLPGHLSCPSTFVPPSEGLFPENFSVLITLRGQPANQSVLLSIYDELGARQLGLALGPALRLLGDPFRPLPQQVNLMDGR